jgi:hypothetical protein
MDLFIATLIVACFAEVLARHRTFIIPADHRMLAIHVVFFLLSHLIPNPGGCRSYFLHRRNCFHLFGIIQYSILGRLVML